MMMNNRPTNFLAPETLDEALAALGAGPVTVLAGGTDLMPQSRSGVKEVAETLMSIRRISTLGEIEEIGDAIHIGTLVTINELKANRLIRDQLPLLAEAADQFASDQVRSVATIGGNLCNASPAGDMLPPLMALNAKVVLEARSDGRANSRRLSLQEFLLGPGKTARTDNELLTAIVIPKCGAGHFHRFYKLGRRPALDISTISVAVVARVEGKTMTGVRVALGAVAPTVVRASSCEALLEGAELNKNTIALAAKAAADDVNPISDVRASAWYRSQMVTNIVTRILSNVTTA